MYEYLILSKKKEQLSCLKSLNGAGEGNRTPVFSLEG